VLRSPEDDEQTDLDSVTAADILGGLDAGNREDETLMEPENKAQDDKMAGFLSFLNQKMQATAGATLGPQAIPPSPENTTWNMRVVRAGSIEDVTLQEHRKPDGRGSVWHHGSSTAPVPGPIGPSAQVPGTPVSTGPAPTPPADAPAPEPLDDKPEPD